MLMDEYDIERFWAKVVIKSSDDCWPWTAYTTPDGYGQFGLRYGLFLAHHVAYEFMIGPIPEELEIDHTCHSEAVAAGTCEGGSTCPHRRCTNPAHMEVVTHSENVRRGALAVGNARKTHCVAGHPYDEANTYVRPDGGRHCKTCHRENERKNRPQRRNRQSMA
jgi:hypothetical protein